MQDPCFPESSRGLLPPSLSGSRTFALIPNLSSSHTSYEKLGILATEPTRAAHTQEGSPPGLTQHSCKWSTVLFFLVLLRAGEHLVLQKQRLFLQHVEGGKCQYLVSSGLLSYSHTVAGSFIKNNGQGIMEMAPCVKATRILSPRPTCYKERTDFHSFSFCHACTHS